MVETKEQLKIYFAHAMVDYDTEYEDLCIATINKFYKNCIIHNPKEINSIIDKNVNERGRFQIYFLPVIDKCDMIVAAPALNHTKKRGKFLSGTIKEMIYAIKNNKKVIGLIDDELKEINKNFFSDIEWDVFG